MKKLGPSWGGGASKILLGRFATGYDVFDVDIRNLWSFTIAIAFVVFCTKLRNFELYFYVGW